MHLRLARWFVVPCALAACGCEIDLADHQVLGSACASHAVARNDGHTLPLWRYHAMRLLLDWALAGVNPVRVTECEVTSALLSGD